MFLRNKLSDGTEIWIGRNARENDNICREMEDEHWWLHADGIPSAHIVICDINPASNIIKEAVKIVLNRCNKSKTVDKIRIMCVQCKYVYKKKHFSVGQVEINTQFVKYFTKTT